MLLIIFTWMSHFRADLTQSLSFFKDFYMPGPFLGGFDIKYVYLLEIHMDGPILGGFDIKFVYLLEFHMDGPILGGFDIKGCMFGGFSHT